MARTSAGRVESGGVFDRSWRNSRNQPAAAVGRGRMHVDHGLAAVELFIDRRKRRIAEVLVAITRKFRR
jgi:hypothetical protein